METLDLRGLKCPLPILKAKKKLAGQNSGEKLCILTTDTAAPTDFGHFCRQTGHILLHCTETAPGLWTITVQHK